jgi:hypothetical protein
MAFNAALWRASSISGKQCLSPANYIHLWHSGMANYADQRRSQSIYGVLRHFLDI